MTMNARPAEANRVDCMPCVRINVQAKAATDDSEGLLTYLTRRFYAPLLVGAVTTMVVVCLQAQTD